MDSRVKIDEIDAIILSELIGDARRKITDLAKQCGVSSTAILKRIKRLKAEGVITGTVLFSEMSQIGYLFPVSIGISLNQSQELKILKLIEESVNVIMLSRSIGRDNLFLFAVANNLHEIENLKQIIKGNPHVRKLTISIWGTPTFNFENINLQPTGT